MGTVQQNGAILGNHSVTSTIGKQVWRVRLVHAEPGARVVEASCEEGGQVLAMAFGEATTAEAAEDRARRRAAQLLLAVHPAPAASLAASLSDEADQSGAPADQQSFPPPPAAEDGPGSPAPMGEPDGVGGQPTISPDSAPGPPRQPEPCPVPVEVPGPSPDPVSPPAASASHGGSEPDDWSEDLAMVEVQLERLGWDRNQESVYLERCLGYMERSSITRYQDLRLYIDALQTLSPPADPCTAPLPDPLQQPLPSRGHLMERSNALLRQLGWTTQQGRAFLERHFGHSSRQSLSDEQLMQFNRQLEAHRVSG